MKLVPNAIDFGNVADTFVNGISSITQIAPGFLRVTFHTVKDDSDDPQNIVVGHQIWAASEFADAISVASKVFKEMKATRGQAKVVQLAGMH